jgi:2-keto-4-pentenoate hydratase/2-oxohepta-3-ene-1,7-dioic acid hydratase in catechol pathway
MPIPIDRPGKIICVGLNYKDHAEETGQALPQRPLLFAKWNNVLVGPGDPIVLPGEIDEKIDYEAELGVVIGQRVRSVSKENALEAVRGYVCFNDVSARSIQGSDGQWTRGKSPDTFGPVGPLTPASEIPDPQRLAIRAIVNGETLQDSNTSEMIFPVDEVIAFITQTMTLEPGDLIATGTPSGVGFTRTPPIYLKDGDEVTIEIEGVGSLTNPVRAAA